MTKLVVSIVLTGLVNMSTWQIKIIMTFTLAFSFIVGMPGNVVALTGIGSPHLSIKPKSLVLKIQMRQADESTVWQAFEKRCTDLREYQLTGHQLQATQAEFLIYLKMLEKRNPGKSRGKIIAALHDAAYGSDKLLSLPILGTPLFNNGAETNGWEGVDLICKVKVLGKMVSFVPKFVFTKGGKKVDIAHAFAGLRSDLNRKDKTSVWSIFMGEANTIFGDAWQLPFDGFSKFPLDQLRGDILGRNLANKFHDPSAKGTTLSKAFGDFFKDAEKYNQKNSNGKDRKYSVSGLKAALAEIKVQTDFEEKRLDRMASLCRKMGTKLESEVRVSKWQKQGLPMLDKNGSDSSFSSQNKTDRLEAIRNELTTLQESANSQSDKACKTTQQNIPEFETIKSDASLAIGYIEQANELFAEANRLTNSLNATSDGKNYKKELNDKAARVIKECRQPVLDWDKARKNRGKIAAIKNRIAWAQKLLNQADALGGRSWAAIRPAISAQLNDYLAFSSGNSPLHKYLEQCTQNAASLRSSCNQLEKDFAQDVQTKIDELPKKASSENPLNKSQIQHIQNAVSNIKKSTDRARDCIRSAEKKAQGEAGMPDKEQIKVQSYDPTNLDVAFELLNNSIELESVHLKYLNSACNEMGTKVQIDNRINTLLGEEFPPPKGLRDNLRADKDKMVRLDAIRADIANLRDTSREGANKACNVSAKEAPDLGAVKSSAIQAIRAAKSTEKQLAEARKLSAELKTTLSDTSKIPEIIPYDQELANKRINTVSECRKPGSEFRKLNSNYLAMRSRKTSLAVRSDNVRGLLRQAVNAKFEHADAYKQRFEKMLSAVDAIAAARNERQRCSDLYAHLDDACAKLSAGLYEKQKVKTDEFILVRRSILQIRSEQLARVKAASSEIGRSKDRIYTSAIKAEKCVRVAEQKAQGPSPETVAEADNVKPSCNSAANAASAAKLSDPRFAKVPGIAKRIEELNRVNRALTQEKSASTAAKDYYFNGKPDQAISRLREAKAALFSVDALIQCEALNTRIDRRIDKASRFRDALNEADDAIARCEQPELKNLLRRRGNDTHPVLIEKMARVREQLRLWESFNAAKTALKTNGLAQARQNLRHVRDNAAQSSCTKLADRAQKGIDLIARAQSDKIKVQRAASSCDMGTLQNLQNTYGSARNIPMAKSVFNYAFEASKTCKVKAERERKARNKQQAERDAATRDAECRKDPKYGPGYSAGKPDANGSYYCRPSRTAANSWCNRNNKGSGWRASKITAKGGFGCNQSRKSQRNTINKKCRRKFGPGYYAGRDTGNGKSYCLPTKATANRKCNTMNKGSGWRAGKIWSNGTFDCYKRRATAHRTPRRSGGLVKCKALWNILVSAAECEKITKDSQRRFQRLDRAFKNIEHPIIPKYHRYAPPTQ